MPVSSLARRGWSWKSLPSQGLHFQVKEMGGGSPDRQFLLCQVHRRPLGSDLVAEHPYAVGANPFTIVAFYKLEEVVTFTDICPDCFGVAVALKPFRSDVR